MSTTYFDEQEREYWTQQIISTFSPSVQASLSSQNVTIDTATLMYAKMVGESGLTKYDVNYSVTKDYVEVVTNVGYGISGEGEVRGYDVEAGGSATGTYSNVGGFGYTLSQTNEVDFGWFEAKGDTLAVDSNGDVNVTFDYFDFEFENRNVELDVKLTYDTVTGHYLGDVELELGVGKTKFEILLQPEFVWKDFFPEFLGGGASYAGPIVRGPYGVPIPNAASVSTVEQTGSYLISIGDFNLANAGQYNFAMGSGVSPDAIINSNANAIHDALNSTVSIDFIKTQMKIYMANEGLGILDAADKTIKTLTGVDNSSYFDQKTWWERFSESPDERYSGFIAAESVTGSETNVSSSHKAVNYDVNIQDGDVNYKADTTSQTYRIDTNGVYFEHNSSGSNLLFIDDSANVYKFAADANGRKYFVSSKTNTLVFFDNYDELSAVERAELDDVLDRMDNNAGGNIRQFFQNHPELDTSHLPSDFVNGVQDPDGSIVPPIPGRKPDFSDRTEGTLAKAYEEEDLPEVSSYDGILNSGGWHGQTFGAAGNDYSNADLFTLMRSKEADVAAKAFTDLYERAVDFGAYSDINGKVVLQIEGGGFYEIENTPVGQIVTVYDGNGDMAGRLVDQTSNTPFGDLKQQLLQTVDADGDAILGTYMRDVTTGRVVLNKFVVADDHYASLQGQITGFAADYFAEKLSDGAVLEKLMYQAAFRTISQNFDTFTGMLADGIDANVAVDAIVTGDDIPLPDGTTKAVSKHILDDAFVNFVNVAQGAVAALIVQEVADALEIDGFGGEVFSVVANEVTIKLVGETFDVIFDGLLGDQYGSLFDGKFFEDGFSFDPATMLARFAAAKLAGAIVTPESEMAGIMGSIGATIGAKLGAAVAAGELLTHTAISTVFKALGSAAGPVGIAIGVFVGQVFGTALGNMLGSEDTPQSWATLKYNEPTGRYKVAANWGGGGGSDSISENMAIAVNNFVNEVIEMTGGSLRSNGEYAGLTIGMYNNHFEVEGRHFELSGDAIQHAAFELLKSFDLVGGHAVIMRAWHNSDATNLQEFKEDIEVAEAFQQYLLNPTGILALMMDQPESALAQSWAAILQRAAELELHLPHEKDLDGGWGELLLARGDIDPSLLPDIEGDSIVLTDPVTGEETILHHVIGPGYEIVRIEGTDGDDIIQVIVDGPSITHVDAGAGDDVIEGSDERDIILGGAGDDTIDGHDGDDWIHGGSGNDYINGNGGLDFIYGGDDDDDILGGTEDDKIHGGAGNDTINGASGSDSLYGGSGNDTLNGNEGIDYLYGEDGNDVLEGYALDHSYGGKGDDTFNINEGVNYLHIHRNDGHDQLNILEGASGTSLLYMNHIFSNELWIHTSNQDYVMTILGENQSVTFKDAVGGANANLNIVFEDQTISLSSFAAIHSNQSAQNIIPEGEEGIIADIYLDATNDTATGIFLSGGAGNDTLYGYDDTTDVLVGGLGNDTIRSKKDADFLYGGAGDDFLLASNGRDIVYGGYGNDTLYGGYNDDKVYGGAGDDYILVNPGGMNELYGEDGNDIIDSDDGDDVLDGGNGNDTLNDLGGNNTLLGGAGNDVLKVLGNGANVLRGGEGDDRLIYTLSSQKNGTNDYHGDEGIDTLVVNLTAAEFNAADVQKDLLRFKERMAAGQIDTIHNAFYAFAFALATLDISGVEAIEIYVDGTLSDINYVDQIGTSAIDTINGGTDHEKIIGHEEDDIISGGAGHDYIDGGDGNDDLSGDAGYDDIIGGNGNDTISGGDDTDIIDGGEGDDIISGDAGADIINAGYGIDTVSGGDGDDRIDGGSGDDTLYGDAGNDKIYGGSGGDTIDGGDGDDHIEGGTGDDTITGGSGNDTLLGGTGNDEYVFNIGDGEDTITDSYGISDFIRFGAGILQSDIILADVNDDLEITFAASSTDKIVIQGHYTNTGTIEELRFDDGALMSLRPPEAVDDSFDAELYTETAFNILDNDDISYGLNHSVSIRTDVTHGTLTLAPDFTVTYTPDAGYIGADSFVYELNDSHGHITTATVDINVINTTSEVPLLFNNGAMTIINTPLILTADMLAVYDANNTNAELIFTLDSIPVNSDLLLSGTALSVSDSFTMQDILDENLTFAPDTDTYGPFGFGFTVSDGANSLSSELFEIIVNRLPVAVLDSFITTATSVTGNLLADNGFGLDSDPDGHALSIQAETITTSLGGSVVISENGDFTYTAASGFVGDDSVEYTLIDALGASGTGTANMHIVNAGDVLGTKGNDTFTATTASDVIRGFEGNDTLRGVQGHDIMYGGDGDDFLIASYGNDIVYGEAGNDRIYGGNDNDILYGGDGDDYLLVNPGGINQMYGGSGNDEIIADSGIDTLYGGSGYDILTGGTGADVFVFELEGLDGNIDLVTDFSTSQGDALDIADLISGYDPLTDAITDFVQITDDGTDSILSVDTDGGADSFVQIATLNNITGLTDEEALETNGNLITV